MNICMLTTSFPQYEGHIQSPFIYHLCTALSKQGVALDIVSPADKGAKLEDRFGKLSIHRFHYFYPASLQRLTVKSV